MAFSKRLVERTFLMCPSEFSVVLSQTLRLLNSMAHDATEPSTGARILDGLSVSTSIETEVKDEISHRVKTQGLRPPHLTALLVGEDPPSHTYVANKIKACSRSGITSDTVRLPASVSEAALLYKIKSLNEDSSVDGILVQLPVPSHLSERRICNAIHPAKDVDGFHVTNMGRLFGNEDALMPATPLGIVELIRRYGIDTRGKTAVVCGRSKNVGLPIAMLLHSDGDSQYPGLDATTVICHRYTPIHVLRSMTAMADILVVAVGQPGLVTGDMVKPGVAVFDVGINIVGNNDSGKRRIIGDVDFASVAPKASFITPVPGGVGPMTVAMLLKNTLKAAKKEVQY